MKYYTISLEVLTPVYIGSGAKITKKDFLINGHYAQIYDPLKLHAILGEKYERFLMNNLSLTDFLQRSNLREEKELADALMYSVSLGDKSIRKSDSIDEFIKDPYGLPYIPGSSLKGAIRTAILANLIHENKGAYRSFYNDRIDQYGSSREIEEKAFGSIKDSAFKSLKLSDSRPIDAESLILSKKIDVFKDGQTNNKLNLCRESLRAGTKAEFSLTVDSSRNVKYFEPDYILKAINFFANQYQTMYLNKFGFARNSYGENILYLGGGTGFLTKTVNHSIYGEATPERVSDYLDKRFRRHKHYKDKTLGVSPRVKKCTIINHETIEMGICKIRINQNETD